MSSNQHHESAPYVIILSGPTASGKTSFSLELAKTLSIEIINADVGQFYKPLSIGTTKPLWEGQKAPHHLFDIINQPNDCTVVQYRKLVIKKINNVWKRGNIPVLVGGSLFYLKSLVFPPLELSENNEDTVEFSEKELKDLSPWEQLNVIDSKRAEQIHPNDVYRINRALEMWRKTKRKPSELKPPYTPLFHALWCFIQPDLDELKININKRTEEMINGIGLPESWIDEVEKLIGTSWEEFLKIKKLIGYSEIIDWINADKQEATKKELIKTIQTKTWQYAKRQIVFWKGLAKTLKDSAQQSKFLCSLITIDQNKNGGTLLRTVESDLEKLRFNTKAS